MKSTRRVANGQASLAERLALLGFTPGVPDGADDAAFRSIGIDAAVCAGLVCEACGTAGLAYLPLTAGSKYAGVAVCPKCHQQSEV